MFPLEHFYPCFCQYCVYAMNIIVATTDADMLGGIVAQAYHREGGPKIKAIVFLADRRDLDFPWWFKGVAAYKLIGLGGILRIVLGRKLKRPLARDKMLGLGLDWLTTLASPETEILSIPSFNTEDGLRRLTSLNPDVLVSIGAPVIFKAPALHTAKIAAINIHNGRIPKYRGHFGSFWEVMNGEMYGYSCLHEMNPKVDSGRMLAYEKIAMADCGTFFDLMIRKKESSGRLLAKVLKEIERTQQLPDACAPSDSSPEMYFGWPSPRDVLSFKWKRRR